MLKNRWPWFRLVLLHIPGPSIFPKGHLWKDPLWNGTHRGLRIQFRHYHFINCNCNSFGGGVQQGYKRSPALLVAPKNQTESEIHFPRRDPKCHRRDTIPHIIRGSIITDLSCIHHPNDSGHSKASTGPSGPQFDHLAQPKDFSPRPYPPYRGGTKSISHHLSNHGSHQCLLVFTGESSETRVS